MIFVNARFLTQRITGAQRYAIEIARELHDLDPMIRFITPHDVAHRATAHDLGAEVVGRHTGVLWEQFDLPRFLRREGAPLLISMLPTAPVFYRNSIITVHDVCYLNLDWTSRRFHYYYRILMPRLCRTSRAIVTVSEFSKSELETRLRVPREKITVIYNAVSTDFTQHAKTAPAINRGDYVLGVASLNKRKNFYTLVRAFKKANNDTLSLVIVGAADTRIYKDDPDLLGLLESKRVHAIGYVSDADLCALYRDAVVFAYPSLYEGFGIPPIEAMSVGCPVITSNTSSMPEVCGDAACYVDPSDEDALAAAMTRISGDSEYRARLIARGYQRVARFSWRASAETLLQLARMHEHVPHTK